MPNVNFAKYMRYAELTKLMADYASEFPDYVKMERIGRSYEGRDIFLLKVTNYKTGDDRKKPAVWIDGNIHAMEVSTSAVGLYLTDYLTKNYGKDDRVTRAMDTRAFYILPRINPDGAE